MRKKVNPKDVRLLREQRYHMAGEVHFIRSVDDLQEVVVNTMQSVKILMDYMGRCRTKYASSRKVKMNAVLSQLTGLLSRLLRHISVINSDLKPAPSVPSICVPATCITMECVSKILTKLVVLMVQMNTKYDKEYVIGIMAQASRLEQLVDSTMQGALNADKNDIFYKPPTAEEWKELYNGYYVTVETVMSKNFDKKYAELEKGVLTLTAAASKGLEGKDISFGSTVNTIFNAVYYSIFSSKGKQQAELFLSRPNPKTAAKVLNLLDCKFTKPILTLVLPSIAVNKRIYVPKLLPRLTIENVMHPDDLSKHLVQQAAASESSAEDLLEIDPSKRFAENQKEMRGVESTTYITHKMKPIPDTHVKIRVLSPDILPKDRKPGQGPSVKGMNCDRILVDIHGGGFISTTTRCHQTYLRRWAKECNLVIFAVDYTLAPEAKYPALLDDVWQAYYWIITQAERQFGIKLRTVLVAGDSAGGNLSMALTLRAIQSNFRVPDGMLLGYPALNLSIRAFSPSLLTAMDDFILRYSYLNVCLDSYIPSNADPQHDPYLSPSLVSDADLKKFPPIRIMAAGKDPLRDESYKLMHRLAQLKKDAQMVEYRMFPHAFWSLDFVFGLQECKFATDKAIDWIGKLIAKREASFPDKPQDVDIAFQPTNRE